MSDTLSTLVGEGVAVVALVALVAIVYLRSRQQ